MASATLTKSTLQSQAYENINNILNTRTNVADPKDPNNLSNRKYVYDSDPFLNSLNTDDFPYLIHGLPEMTSVSHSFNQKVRMLKFKHRIIVRTKRVASSSNVITDRGRTDMNSICDDLIETFNSVSIKATLQGYRMNNIKLDKTSTDDLVVNNQNVYESEYELTYDQRFTVSS